MNADCPFDTFKPLVICNVLCMTTVYLWCTWYRAVGVQELVDYQQTETWLCCVGRDIAQTLKTIAVELQQPPPVVSSDGGKDEACECTESDLAATKESAQLLNRGVPTDKKVRIFQAVITDIAKFNEDLARGLRSMLLKRTRSEAQASKVLFQYWLDVIGIYPDAKKLRALIEPSFQDHPELAAVKYQNAQPIAESFVR